MENGVTSVDDPERQEFLISLVGKVYVMERHPVCEQPKVRSRYSFSKRNSNIISLVGKSESREHEVRAPCPGPSKVLFVARILNPIQFGDFASDGRVMI